MEWKLMKTEGIIPKDLYHHCAVVHQVSKKKSQEEPSELNIFAVNNNNPGIDVCMWGLWPPCSGVIGISIWLAGSGCNYPFVNTKVR